MGQWVKWVSFLDGSRVDALSSMTHLHIYWKHADIPPKKKVKVNPFDWLQRAPNGTNVQSASTCVSFCVGEWVMGVTACDPLFTLQPKASWASAHRGKWGQLTHPRWKNGLKIKKRKHAKNSSFLCSSYILRAIRAGRFRERRYADHIFIQIYFRNQNALFRSKIFKFFFASVGKGALTPKPKSCGRS